jgi:hypothetical protein
MVLQILRSYHEKGTNGVLLLNGKRVCYTIERTWENNQKRISCIPEGTYTVMKRYTTRFGMHLHIPNVQNRQWILIHAFNMAWKESEGCIGPVAKLTGDGEGISSRIMLDRLLKLLEPAFRSGETIFLIIKKNEDEKFNT